MSIVQCTVSKRTLLRCASIKDSAVNSLRIAYNQTEVNLLRQSNQKIELPCIRQFALPCPPVRDVWITQKLQIYTSKNSVWPICYNKIKTNDYNKYFHFKAKILETN